MKKSTILILLVIFLGSVLIVGIFGMQAIAWEDIVYVDEIKITDIITSDGQDVKIEYDEEINEYYAILKFVPHKVEQVDENGEVTTADAFEVTLVWDYSPKNATNKNVRVSIIEPANPPCDPLTPNAAMGRGDPIVFRKAESLHLRYSAADSATGAKLDIWLYLYVDEDE